MILALLAILVPGPPGLAIPPRLAANSDPVGSFGGAGSAAPLFWTGGGQRINNTSFESGLQPWAQTKINAAVGSSAAVSSTGFGDNKSAIITVLSGNFTPDSKVSLLNDLSGEQVGFGGALRLRATVFVSSMTGNTSADRVEVSTTLTTSHGDLRTIHYLFAAGTSHDLHIRYTDSNNNSRWDIGESVVFNAHLTGTYDASDTTLSGSVPSIGAQLNNDPKLDYVDQNSNGLWNVGEPIVYDVNNDSFYEFGEPSVYGGKSQTVTDIYIDVPAFGTTGQWIVLDTNVAADALAFSSVDYAGLNSVRSIQLVVSTKTFGIQNRDPHLKFYDSNSDMAWEPSEQVIYDANLNGVYDSGEPVLCACSAPGIGAPLSVDPKIKFVDPDNNGVWDSGETIVYDTNYNGVYDLEPMIYGPPPRGGTLLMRGLQRTTIASFDQVELYSATGNYDWVRNGSFDTGTLAGWGQNSTFTTSTAASLSPPYSAEGNVTGSAMEMAQSIDSRPRIESWTRFKASVEVRNMTGDLPADSVDIWLGLIDSRGKAVSVYYYFKTGDGSIPFNTTDTIYHKAPEFGKLTEWLSIDAGLLNETVAFNLLGYSSPYRLEVIVVEGVARATSSTTTAFFDDISVYQPWKPGSSPSQIYATKGSNSTYTYTGANIPYGSFYVDIPGAQTILNVTSPEGAPLQPGEYATQPAQGLLRITVPSSTMFKHAPLGIWRVTATSTNALSTLYVEDSTAKIMKAIFNLSAQVNFVSRTNDPLGIPQAGASVNLTLIQTSSATVVGAWSGKSDAQGWYNITGMTLPSRQGDYLLQATVQAAYVGVRIYSLILTSPRGPEPGPQFSPVLLALIGGASAVAILAILTVFRRRRRGESPTKTTLSSEYGDSSRTLTYGELVVKNLLQQCHNTIPFQTS
ncbi:hypothetical protein AUG19_05995 [archaeon 13_1_20CM_2_54_9]|nr:MAG: hypothetical protein AUG19_05995 [archaeon 13_1_20CM_2_54_9]